MKYITIFLIATVAVCSNQAVAATPILSGGVGGNEKIGMRFYDGETNHAPALTMIVDDDQAYEGINVCLLRNNTITVQDVSYPDQPVAMTSCVLQKNQHNGTAWMSLDENETRWQHDEVNGGYSPSLDALYAATQVEQLYQKWYGVPVLVNNKKTAMPITIRTHYGRNYENAFWDNNTITFGDGGKRFYPLTTLDMTAHELSHGYTEQHSNINSAYAQMAALHESFSDMAAMALQFEMTGRNDWQIGYDFVKDKGSLRYLDDPTQNGAGIDHMKNFHNTEAHAAAGITNKVFYLIATSPGWNTHKAFNIMVQANNYYWTASMKTFQQAACGVISATSDYHYPVTDVQAAFAAVGIDTSSCF